MGDCGLRKRQRTFLIGVSLATNYFRVLGGSNFEFLTKQVLFFPPEKYLVPLTASYAELRSVLISLERGLIRKVSTGRVKNVFSNVLSRTTQKNSVPLYYINITLFSIIHLCYCIQSENNKEPI